MTITEVARCLGMRPPSVYKYFPSIHAVYDTLFAVVRRDLMPRLLG